MAQNALIQVRVDDELKQEADKLFMDLGFDTPTAIRIFLKHSIKRQGLPFEVSKSAPNSETIATIKGVEAGRNLHGPYTNIKELMDSLLNDTNV